MNGSRGQMRYSNVPAAARELHDVGPGLCLWAYVAVASDFCPGALTRVVPCCSPLVLGTERGSCFVCSNVAPRCPWHSSQRLDSDRGQFVVRERCPLLSMAVATRHCSTSKVEIATTDLCRIVVPMLSMVVGPSHCSTSKVEIAADVFVRKRCPP